ncbi:ATP-grasp domain-containing protein [Azospirillum sp. sgz301742]
MPPANTPAERPPAERPDVVVAALSARALAAAARRAGRTPAAIDLFGDGDTRSLAKPSIRLPHMDTATMLEALARPELRGAPLVYGAGFEDDPARLARIAAERPVLGNAADVVARAKDPFAFAALLDRLGIPHPEVARTVAGPADGYLLKRMGGSGGTHIAVAADGIAPPGCYFQRRTAGHPVSVLFLANGHRAAVVGLSRQWTAPAPGKPYRYGGAAGPLRLPARLSGLLSGMVARLTAALGLVGLNSADFLLAGRTLQLLEINPRLGASLDVFDHEPMPPLFGLHLNACAGRLPERLPAHRGCRAAAVLYADVPTLVGHDIRWPVWIADRPSAPACIESGEPVCTVLADGAGVGSARRMVERRQMQMAASLEPASLEPMEMRA